MLAESCPMDRDEASQPLPLPYANSCDTHLRAMCCQHWCVAAGHNVGHSEGTTEIQSDIRFADTPCLCWTVVPGCLSPSEVLEKAVVCWPTTLSEFVDVRMAMAALLILVSRYSLGHLATKCIL